MDGNIPPTCSLGIYQGIFQHSLALNPVSYKHEFFFRTEGNKSDLYIRKVGFVSFTKGGGGSDWPVPPTDPAANTSQLLNY